METCSQRKSSRYLRIPTFFTQESVEKSAEKIQALLNFSKEKATISMKEKKKSGNSLLGKRKDISTIESCTTRASFHLTRLLRFTNLVTWYTI